MIEERCRHSLGERWSLPGGPLEFRHAASRAEGPGRGDQLLQPGETALGKNEATRIVREPDHPEEGNEQCQRRDAKRERGARNCGRGDPRREKQSAAPAKGAELRHEPEPSFGMAHDHAREERKAHADVRSVVYYDVVETLQFVTERVEIGVEGFRRDHR